MNINNEEEYNKITPFAGTVLSTFRLSLGDFSFDLVKTAEDVNKKYLFYACWFTMVIVA